MNESYQYQLSGVSIDEIAQKTETYLGGLKMSRQDQTRIRLSMEEILLNWQAHFGEETLCTFRTGIRFGHPILMLELTGTPCDPLACADDYDNWSRRMLASIGLSPVYQYENGKNQVVLKLKKHRINPVVPLLLAVAAAVLAGFMGNLLPVASRTLLLDNLINPVYETFLGILDTVAGPMIFLSVAWGIYSIGDLSMLGRIGRQMLARFIGITSLAALLTAGVAFVAFDLKLSTTATDISQAWSILHLFLDIFPDNMLSPLLEGNMLQILLMSSIMGGTLLVLGRQVKIVASLVEQLNSVIQHLLELIGMLIPVFIFVVLVQIIWSGSIEVITKAWKPSLLFIGVTSALLVFCFARAGFASRISPLLLVKKCMPSFMIALTTASATAAYGTARSCCRKQLGISRKLTNFGLPLGFVFFPPVSAIYFVLINFYMAESYGIEISITWVLLAVIISISLAIAAPPVAGGSLTCYTIMFMQLGIPSQALMVALALDVLSDFIAAPSEIVLLELELAQQAEKLDMLKRDVLRQPNSNS